MSTTETQGSSGTSSSPNGPMTVSRRVLRKTLNDALAIAGNAVQLDASGEYQRSIEAYQQSVDLLEHGISLMRLQREVGGERPGRDTTHEISQLEQIREKYKSRIEIHLQERARKAAALAAKDKAQSSAVSTSSSRRSRTPQSAMIPPLQPPPTAPLPPIPYAGPPTSTGQTSLILQKSRPRGASLPANQQPPKIPHEAAFTEASTKPDLDAKSPRSPPTPATPHTIQLNAAPLPAKHSKSSGRPLTAPGPSAPPPPARVRTTSGATPPKRSHSSTALNTSASHSNLDGRLSTPVTPKQALFSPSTLSTNPAPKRSDLIPLRNPQAKLEIPPFVTIFGLEPVTNVTAPAPPPKPTDPHRHPYHLLRLVLGTLTPPASPSRTGSQPTGGFITPKLYVPSSLWHQTELWTLVLDLPEKVRLLETLRETLRTVHESSVILFGPVVFSSLRAPAKLKKSPSTENSLPTRQPLSKLDDPVEWLQALERLASALGDLEKSSSKKLGLGENGASVKKRMMDWSTRVAKKAVGGKGPSSELMDAYVDALTGICNFGPMLDAHFCALKTLVPTPRAGPVRRPTISRTNTSEALNSKQPLSPQTQIPGGGAIPDFLTDPDVLPPAITQLVPKYSALPKDLAVLIEGLQQMRNGEWMGIQL